MTREELSQAFVAFRERTIVDSVVGQAGAEVVSHLARGLAELEGALAAALGLTWNEPPASGPDTNEEE